MLLFQSITSLLQQMDVSEQCRRGRHLNPQGFMTKVSYLFGCAWRQHTASFANPILTHFLKIGS